MAEQSTLKKVADWMGIGKVAQALIKRDKANTKAGKKSEPKRKY